MSDEDPTEGINRASGSDDTTEDERAGEDTAFTDAKEGAIKAIDREDVQSMYVGLIDEEGENEFYFGNAPEGDLQRAAVTQLGMLTRVLASQSDTNVEHIAQLAAERAREMDLR
jgi:hypothetical protein